MKREIVKINEDLCNGCGLCVPNCAEGALQIIDGKARLISDLLCDGLGACLGHCPEGAIEIEEREAEPYNETEVMKLMVKQGKNTVVAHIKHLQDHGETDFVKEAISFLKANERSIDFSVSDVINEISLVKHPNNHGHGGGCPGMKEISFDHKENNSAIAGNQPSELRQWPVQMHLINPNAQYFKKADLLLAADCVAFAVGNFHSEHLRGKKLAIACPKLDSNMQVYVEKITSLIDNAEINTLTVMIMEVPCCNGLIQMAKLGADKASRKVPVKLQIISLQGDLIKEEWI